MASTLALGPAITAFLTALRASVALTTYVGLRVYPDGNGDVPARPAYPYVSVESISEASEGMNTMGLPTAAKWGSVARVRVRVGSQSRTEMQGLTMSSLCNQVLDGQTLSLTGYTYATVEATEHTVHTDITGGVVTREFLNDYAVWVHQ